MVQPIQQFGALAGYDLCKVYFYAENLIHSEYHTHKVLNSTHIKISIVFDDVFIIIDKKLLTFFLFYHKHIFLQTMKKTITLKFNVISFSLLKRFH